MNIGIARSNHFLQLSYVYSVSIVFTCYYALDSAVTVKSILVNLNIAAFKADASCAFTCADDGFDILQLIFQLYFYISTIIAYFDIVVTAEVNIIAGFYVGYFGCNTVGSQVPACIFSCSLQLYNVYSIGSFTACCYIGNLTSNFFTLYRTAYRYSTTVCFPSKAVCTFRSKRTNSTGFSICNRESTDCNRLISICFSLST